VTPCYQEALAYADNNQNVYLYSFEHVPRKPIFDEEYINVDIFGVKKRVLKRQYQDITREI